MTQQDPPIVNPGEAQVILSTDPLVDKARWALVKQISTHTNSLNGGMFDDLDDFLFEHGSRGCFSDQNNYLRVMREFRNKRELYERSFLEILITSLDTIPSLNVPVVSANASVPTGHTQRSPNETDIKTGILSAEPTEEFRVEEISSFDQLELDLAFSSMERRALKRYSSMTRQLTNKADDGNPELAVGNDLLVTRVLEALKGSHGRFRLSLDGRLLFFKIFEQKFLWKMEKMYLDLINVINNKSDQMFVNSLYSSALLLIENKGGCSQETFHSEAASEDLNNNLGFEFVNNSATAFIDELCLDTDIPGFINRMLRSYWLEVLVLVGIHQGVDSSQWHKAKQAVLHLIKSVMSTQAVTSGNHSSRELTFQLRKGFELIQMSQSEIDEFFHDLDLFAAGSIGETTTSQTITTTPKEATNTKSSRKAAISEEGRKILDDDDLDDIVALLSEVTNSGVEDEDSGNVDSSLEYYLGLIDKLIAGKEFEFSLGDVVHVCRIRQISSGKNSYQVLSSDGQVLLVRSRIGLAVSAKAGEIRSCGAAESISFATDNQPTLTRPPNLSDTEFTVSH